MEVIRELVTTIVIILILAALLEMILPNSQMQRFVKVIMGLFIIITLLNPLVGLLNQDLNQELVNWQVMEQQGELESILAQGKAISDESTAKALVEYEKRLGEQMLSLIRLAENNLVQRVEVQVSRNEEKGNAGQIEEVLLIVSDEKNKETPEKEGVADPILPIEVKLPEKDRDSKARDPTDIYEDHDSVNSAIEIVTSFYGLQKEQIRVVKAE